MNNSIYPTPTNQPKEHEVQEQKEEPKKSFPYGYVIAALIILVTVFGWKYIHLWVFAIDFLLLLVAIIWSIVGGRKTKGEVSSPAKTIIYIIWSLLSLIPIYVAISALRTVDTPGVGLVIAMGILGFWAIVTFLVIWATKRAR